MFNIKLRPLGAEQTGKNGNEEERGPILNWSTDHRETLHTQKTV